MSNNSNSGQSLDQIRKENQKSAQKASQNSTSNSVNMDYKVQQPQSTNQTAAQKELDDAKKANQQSKS